MKPEYQAWLTEQQYTAGTVAAQLHRVRKVEEVYGSLDEHIANDTFDTVIDELSYSTEDERRNRPNPSKIVFQGNIRNNLQSYKDAVIRYRKFVSGWQRSAEPTVDNGTAVTANEDGAISDRRFTLERDLQRSLRENIKAVDPNLRIVDDGAERFVESGFIDITCEHVGDGAIVVVELKAGKADGRAVAQVLGYMGDIALEERPRQVRGLLIAQDFDQRARSAARVVPSLELLRYSVSFTFRPDADSC